MDYIDEVLANAAVDDNNLPAIQAAATLGKNTLNRYYHRTDFSEVYRIAMGKSSFCCLLSW